ncbi:MAG: 50S ribosomal protein L29 [Sulfolobales archaeon]
MVLSPDEIRSMSKEDRLKLLRELRTELLRLRAQASAGTLDKPHRIKIVRKNIARILTIEREEALEAGGESEKKS